MLSVLVVGLAVVAARADDDDDPEPAPRTGGLTSEWELSELKAKGMAFPLPPELLKVKLEFRRDGTLSMSAAGQDKTGKWKVNAAKSPGELDMTVDGMKSQMIYRLEKDSLSIAGGKETGGARPKDFDSAEMTMVFKRARKK